MSHSVIGAQLYTLRDHLKTPADIASTLAKVRKMGYENVQVSGLGPIEPKELAKILKSEGLHVAATHVSLDMMKDVAKCLDYHETLGCDCTAIGGFFKPQPTREDYIKFAHEFNAIAQPYADTNLVIGYHNHSHELIHFGGEPALELLIRELDKTIWFEIDTYWIAHGGGDPAAWINKVAGRIPAVHFKDLVMMEGTGQTMTEVGAGNLNWPTIIEACKKAGVRWFMVERDSGLLDPFESLKVSLDNLRKLGLH